MIIVLMGPAGAGKTTVGRALAAAAGWPFFDADDLHTDGSIEKMRRGTALDDGDRQPWLERVRQLMLQLTARGTDAVLACSALRERYRTVLSSGVPGLRFVLLDADRSLLEERLAARRGHFAGTAILDRQLEDLEVPADALIVDAGIPVASIVARICRSLGLPCGPATSEP